jgi:large subunit ribosomal protein L24
MLNRCHIKKDDKVKVIAGKDKGKISKVLKVIDKKNKVLVERVNLMKRHTRPNVKNRQGGIVEGEAAIHWSNVMLICSSCMTPIRVKIKQLDDGKNVRMCRKCQEIIDR